MERQDFDWNCEQTPGALRKERERGNQSEEGVP